jgi:uncharacterized protein
MKHLLFVAALGACSPPSLDADRRIVTEELVAEVVIPTLDDVVAATTAMRTSVEAFVASPSVPALHDTQAAWRMARVAWKRADAFSFGPAKDLRLVAAMDQAVDFLKIETEVSAAEPVTDAYVETLGANANGFHAIEYLIFGGDDTARLALLTSDIDAPRRRDLLVAYAHNLARHATELRAAWTAEQESITNPAGGNEMYPTIEAPIDAFVNQIVFLAEFDADARLGKPSGTGAGGTPQPQLEESAPSDNSLVDLADSLRGLRDIYFGTRDGTPGKGIGKLVAIRSTGTDASMRTALDVADADVAAIPPPLRTALEAKRDEIPVALDSIKEVKRILATEVVGQLGVTLNFNDNDGD